MKKVLSLVVLLLTITMVFSINFGGGGFTITYIPPDQLSQTLPEGLQNIVNTSDLSEGFLGIGGGGKGRIGKHLFMGGEGFSGLVSYDDYEIYMDCGFFTISSMFNFFDFINIEAGLGLGGYIQQLRLNFSGTGETIEDFINGDAPYINTLNFEAFAASFNAALYLNPSTFFSFFVKGDYVIGYAPKSWTFENGKKIVGVNEKLSAFYTVSSGITFGF